MDIPARGILTRTSGIPDNGGNCQNVRMLLQGMIIKTNNNSNFDHILYFSLFFFLHKLNVVLHQ